MKQSTEGLRPSTSSGRTDGTGSGRTDQIPSQIPSIDQKAQELCRKRWDSLTKPQGSLGRLEDLAVRIAGMTGWPIPPIQRKVIFTAAADHGVTAEGVSAYPQAVTVQMVSNFLEGGAGINVLARQVGAEVLVVDVGVASPIPARDGLVQAKIRPGTGNMAKEPAMTRQEAQQSIETGMEIFKQKFRSRRIDLVGLGEMGIGNTTAAAALSSVLTGQPVSEVTGRGTGIGDAQLSQKILVIEEALKLHRPDRVDPIGCLAAVGGLEIGCLAGIALAAASVRVPVMLDGFISTAAGLLACRIDPVIKEYLIASHQSVEPGHRIQLESLGLEPLLKLRMRLGEGTGAALGFFLVESSLKLLTEMATFAEAGVSEKGN